MRSNNPNATHFLLRRNLFIGVVVFLVVFFTLPMWGLSHIPEMKKDIQLYYPPEEMARSFSELVSSRAIHSIDLETRCILFGGLGFLTAIMLFRHLFSRKQGMLHASLPEKREKDYLRRLLGYLVLGLGPVVLNYVLYLLIVLANGLIAYVDWGYLLGHMGMMLLVNVYGFAVGVLSSVLTGTWWAALLAGTVLVVGFEGLSLVWHTLAGKYLHTYVDYGYSNALKTFSPTCTLYKGVYKPGEARLLPGLISCVLCFGAGLYLYRIRRTEATERTLAFDWLHAVMGFVLPVMGGSLMGVILMYSFASETGLVLGLTLGTLLTFWVCRMVFNQRFCGILRQWYLPVAAVIVLLLCLGALHTDVMGYDHYLPQRDEVRSITYQPIGYRDSDETITLSSPDALDAAYAWCEMMRGEVDGMENGLDQAYLAVTDSCVLVTYQLENRTVVRRYPNQDIRNDAQPCLQAIIESDDYRRSLIADYHLEDGSVRYLYMNCNAPFGERELFYDKFGVLPDLNLNRSEDPQKMDKILLALRDDVEDRSFSDKKKREIFTLDLSFHNEETGEDGYINVPIFAGDENVLKAIFGNKAVNVTDYLTGGYAADENIIVLQATMPISRAELQRSGISSFEMEYEVTEASSPEEAVEWVRGAQHSGQHRRYFMPDYEEQSYSYIYIYDIERLKQYQASGDNFQIPEDHAQMVNDRNIPITTTLHCIGK